MKQVRELKKELGSRYVFERLLSERDVRRLMKLNPKLFEMKTVLSLAAGCVKIELVLYPKRGKLTLGYDLFVKDSPESQEWICYESLDCLDNTISFRERDILSVLDSLVQEKGLSYTKCCFEKLNGKILNKKTETA